MAEGNLTPCVDPASGETFAGSALTPASAVPGLLARARAAQPAWAALPLAERVRRLRRVRDVLVQDADSIADLIRRDNGKTRNDALATEILPAAMAVSFYLKHARSFLRPERLAGVNLLLANKRARMAYRPYGVVAIVSPWNYPFAIPFSELAMALLAGNAVALKAASLTQAVGRKLEECFRHADLPDGLFAYLNLPGADAGGALLDAGVDKLFFTGSVQAGRWLMERAARTLTPLVLELGGNDPMLVLADADLERAAAGAIWAGFQNGGQSCGGVERIYVEAEAYEPFMAAMKRRLENLRIGPDRDFDADIGALTSAAQAQKVEELVQEALRKGARVWAQSDPRLVAPSGAFMPARVLAGVDHSMRLMREEIFGPAVGVMKFATIDEGVALANDSELALTASVWSRSRRRASGVAGRLHAGVVTVNDHLMSHGLANTPWGGWKKSGFGWTHGRAGFREMVHGQVLVHDVLPLARRNMWWHPHDRKLYEGLRGAIDLLYGRGLKRRLAGMARLLRIVPRYFTR